VHPIIGKLIEKVEHQPTSR